MSDIPGLDDLADAIEVIKQAQADIRSVSARLKEIKPRVHPYLNIEHGHHLWHTLWDIEDGADQLEVVLTHLLEE